MNEDVPAGSTGGSRRRSGLRLSEHEVVSLMRCVVAIGALMAIAVTVADPDLWGHVRFGEDILDDGAIASSDPYSFTSDQTWVNHEWLAEVLMALGYRAGGSVGIVLLKVATVAGALLLVSLTLKRVSWRPVDHDALLILAILAMLTRTHSMRPQVFSVLLFAALLFAITGADRGNRRLLAVIPLLMVAWTNLHGGWTVGLGVLTIWTVVRLLQRAPGAIDARVLALVWISSVGATLANPYGLGLWTFLRETVGLSRMGIADWQPLLDLPLDAVVPAVAMAALALFALAKARRTADPAYVLIVAALAIGALRISRIDVFFGLAVIMLLGPYLGRIRAAGSEVASSSAPPLWRRPIGIAILAAVTTTLGVAGASTVSCVKVADEPEREAVSFLEGRVTGTRVLTYFDWGEFAIWHLAPDVKVSMDGRRETVYSDELFQAHLRLYIDRPGATGLVRRLAPDLVWLPAHLPVVSRLEREGWRPVFLGPASVILEQGAAPPTTRAGTQPERCFPDA